MILGYVSPMMKLLERENTGLLVVDVQEKLMPVMEREEVVVANIIHLLHLAECFALPVILTEHHVRWLGATVPQIVEALPAYEPITKMHFNCCDVEAFNERLGASGLENIILTGVESHICLFQTCVSLEAKGYQVHVPRDAVDSRTRENLHVGLELMKESGAFITSTETVIYQLLKKAGTKEFKKMLKRIK